MLKELEDPIIITGTCEFEDAYYKHLQFVNISMDDGKSLDVIEQLLNLCLL